MNRWAAGISAAVAAAGSLVVMGLAGPPYPAGANPSGASPGVFVVGPSSAGKTTVAAIDAGGASVSPVTFGTVVTAVAINTTATKAVFALLPVPAAVATFPHIAVIDIASGAGTSVVTNNDPIGIAVDPTDPNRAYVLESSPNPSGGAPITEIDTVGLNSSPPSDTVLVSGTGRVLSPDTIAISPDGSTLFVGGTTGSAADFEAVPVANPTQPTSLVSRIPGTFADLAVAPNGSSLFAISTQPSSTAPVNQLFAYPLPFQSGEAPTWVQRFGTAQVQLVSPTCLTVSPDGSALYVSGNLGISGTPAPSAVEEFNPANGSPGAFSQVPIQTTGKGPGGLMSESVNPDGRQLIVAGTDGNTGGTTLYSLGLPSLTLGPANNLGTGFGYLGGPQELAVTPDQAPAAAFSETAAAAGSASTFNAAGSSVAYGSVTSFSWKFGDGQSATTGAPTAAHTYASPGNYTVTLVETDSAGTSVPPSVGGTFFSVDGPGQTPFKRADPSATVTHQISVPPRGTTPTTLPGAPATPTLVLNPALGPPGTLVTVTGSGFAPNIAVTISWSVSTGSVVINSDSSGNLSPTVLPVLVPDILGPRFAVASSTPAVQAPFLVVPGSAEPGGHEGSYLFRSEGP